MANLELKPSILQIIPNLDSGGAEKTAIDIARAIVEEGWSSTVISQGGRMVEDLKQQGSDHIMLPAASKNPVRIIRNAIELVSVIRRNKVSIIHARSRAPAWSGLIAARKCGIPFVTTYHGAYKQSSRLKALYNSVMVRSDITIANSIWTAEFVKSRYPSLKSRIEVVYRGTDFSEFDLKSISELRQEKLRDQWDVDRNQQIVLNLARISAIKGQRTLIDAIPQILPSNPNAVFVFAGGDSGHTGYRQALEQRCEELNIAENIRFPGYCDDPAAAYSISDLSTVTSHQPETFGRAAVEAQALGSLVIVTDLGGARETVLAPPAVKEELRTGWKVPPNNVDALATTINAVLRLDAPTRTIVRENARAHVQNNFSTRNMQSRTIDLYRSLLDAEFS